MRKTLVLFVALALGVICRADAPASDVVLAADGATDTYELISSKGFSPVEAPDFYPENHPGVKHIEQVYDKTLGKWVFAMHIHVQDKDRGTTATDRQRNEVKTDKKSPANVVGTPGETHVYTWKFRLPEGFQATNSFCHIHQIKMVDGDDSMPAITLTVRRMSNGKERLEVIYVKGKDADPEQKSSYLAVIPLSDVLGEWVEVTESVEYDDHGAYSCKVVRLKDKKTLIDISSPDTDLWREGSSIGRPKWGIYRSLGKGGSLAPQLRDETVLFADFEIAEYPAK